VLDEMRNMLEVGSKDWGCQQPLEMLAYRR
jgi:hypothetical protein